MSGSQIENPYTTRGLYKELLTIILYDISGDIL